jgi:diguanylate cyclase (GGDEF)-like protein
MPGPGAAVLRTVLRGTGASTVLATATALTVAGGGATGPTGLLLPVAVVFFALYTPARQFLLIAAAGTAAYWAVVITGGAPVAYPLLCTLAFGGVAYLCLTHAAVLASLRRRLDAVSGTDPLTLCLNRRGTQDRLTAELATAERTGTPLAVMLADLDDFKAVNDTYGHQAGDDLLVWAARALGRVVRGRDVVGRVGGDEFAVILPGADATQAARIADRLRSTLDGIVPASIGYACFPDDGRTVTDLAHVADTRTYADKVARERTPPGPDAVAAARAEIGSRRQIRVVLPHERRRRSIADMGWLAIFNFSVGMFYIAVLSDSPHRPLLALLDSGGLICGLALVSNAQRLSRSPHSLRILMVNAVVTFPLGSAVSIIDGGVLSPLAIGLLSPMPLIALGAPAQVTVPVISAITAMYTGVAVLGGTPSGWFVVTNLVVTLALSVVCGIQGRAAALRRRLLTQLTRRDPLTEALNRRGFEEEFTARADRPQALLIFDLDGFKQLNDTHGHAAGDELLRWVVTTLTASVGPDDVVGRLGGDEFVVLAAGDPGPVAQRLHAALAVRTEVSVGTAALGEHGTDFDALYAHADAELYREKAARRGTSVPHRAPHRTP